MNMQAKSQKNGQLIAIGGMVVALIGFFFVPFVTISYINTQSQQSQTPQTPIPSSSYSAIQAASLQGFIWLNALLAFGILLVALLLAFSHNPFDMSRVPLEKQLQRGAYVLIGASVISLLVQYIVMQTIPGSLVGMFSSLSSASGSASSSIQSLLSGLSMSYTTGSWFYVVGMLIAVGGEIYALRAAHPASVVAAPGASPNMLSAQGTPSTLPQPSSPYQQDWQQPYQQPYPPQQVPQQYPPQQAWQPPQPPADYQ